MDFVIGHGVITDGTDLMLHDGAIHISDGVIKKIDATERLRSASETFYDLRGRLVLPGLTNFHHHLYSALAAGISPAGPTDTFVQILENLWWKLDRALDEETIYFSALQGVMDSVAHGVTTIFDHHASMNFIRGSLDIIADVFRKAGINGLLCFEMSDRAGIETINDQLRENIEFWDKHRNDRDIKGILGLHANFTLSEKTMELISKEKPDDMGVHIHCGEDRYDFDYCRKLGYAGPVDRLDKWNLLNEKTILAHAIHLSDRDYELIRDKKPVVVSNPESNANNQVGVMDRGKIREFVLGTDGMSGDMVQTMRSLYLLGKGHLENFTGLRELFFDRARSVLQRFFPEKGGLKEGAPADIAVLDYIPVTPINLDNLIGHLIFGAKNARAFMTIANGKIVYHNGEFSFVDAEKAREEIKKAALKLWDKFREA